MNGDWRRGTVPPHPHMKDREQLPADLMVNDLDPACPRCGDLCHPTATRCENCCARLYPKQTTAPARTPLDEQRAPGQTGGTLMPKTCTCGGRQICTACVLESYENDPFSRSVDLFLNSVRRADTEPNVIPFRADRKQAS